MAQDWSKPFYNSEQWLKCKTAYLQSRNYVCERCGRLAVIVHHKKHITPANVNDPNITLNWDNLMAVCQECHNALHGYSGPCVEGLEFSEEGDLFKSPPIRGDLPESRDRWRTFKNPSKE